MAHERDGIAERDEVLLLLWELKRDSWAEGGLVEHIVTSISWT